MDKFVETYKNIIDNVDDPSKIGRDCNSEGKYGQLSHILLQNIYFEAIDQNQFSQLAPVPKPLLNYLCENIKPNKQNSFTITYQKMYQLLKEYNYKDLYDFKQSLQILTKINDDSGYLVIGVCELNESSFKRIFESKEMDSIRLKRFFNSCREMDSGNTFSGSPLLKSRYKNACIWLNLNWSKIAFSNWKDTLSHQLTHFIHRVVSISKTSLTGKVQKELLNNSDFNLNDYFNEEKINKFQKIFNQLLKNYDPITLQYIWSLYKGTLFGREQSTTIQNILNGFQRMYQQQNIKNNRPKYKKFNDSLQKREKWLDQLLKKIIIKISLIVRQVLRLLMIQFLWMLYLV